MTDLRIDLLSPADAKQAAVGTGMPESRADLSVFRVLLRSPVVARTLSSTLDALLYDGQLDPRLRELIIMRIAWRERAVYEWTRHWIVSKRLGLDDQDILGVKNWPNHPDYGPTEQAALAATDQWIDHHFIDDRTWVRCRAVLPTDALLIEMVAVIANWSTFAGLLKSLTVPLEEGLSPWPPNGRPPISS